MKSSEREMRAINIEANGILTGAGKTACLARTVNEELLQDIILKAINEMILDKSGYIKMLQENIATVIRNDASASTDDIDAKLVELQKELCKK